jgi:hypothetical protein
VEDDSISTAAKIEFAEVHNRPYHLIKHKSDRPAIDHLIVHELTHLELAEKPGSKTPTNCLRPINRLRELSAPA